MVIECLPICLISLQQYFVIFRPQLLHQFNKDMPRLFSFVFIILEDLWACWICGLLFFVTFGIFLTIISLNILFCSVLALSFSEILAINVWKFHIAHTAFLYSILLCHSFSLLPSTLDNFYLSVFKFIDSFFLFVESTDYIIKNYLYCAFHFYYFHLSFLLVSISLLVFSTCLGILSTFATVSFNTLKDYLKSPCLTVPTSRPSLCLILFFILLLKNGI